MQGWRGLFALGTRVCAFGLVLVSLVAFAAPPEAPHGAKRGDGAVASVRVAAADTVSGGGPIDPGTAYRFTELDLASSALTFPRSSSVTLTATVRPGVSGAVQYSANGIVLGTVNVEVVYAADACPPPATAAATVPLARAAAVRSAQKATAANANAAAGTDCGSDSRSLAALTVPANTLPVGSNSINAVFFSGEPAYKISKASLNLTVTDAPTQQVSFMVMPRGDGYDANWKTFVPIPGAGFSTLHYEWDFNGDGVVDLEDSTGAAQVWRYPGPGSYTAKLAVRNSVGGIFSASQEVKVPHPPPILSDFVPLNTTLPVNARPTITAAYSDPLGVDLPSVRIEVDGVNVTHLASVTAANVTYVPAAALAAGIHTVAVSAANPSGSVGQATWAFSVAEVRTYKVNFISPGAGATVVNPQLGVAVDVRTNEGSVSSVTLNGQPMNPTGAVVDGVQRYEGLVVLADGQNILSAVATFDDGQSRSATVSVEYDAPPRVTITSPADKAVFGRAVDTSPGNLTGNVDRPITVSGRVERPVQSVSINQQQAQLDSAGLSFSFPNFFLHEGANLLNVVATDARGRTGSATLSLSVDQTAPILNVESPRPGALTRAGWVDVRGMVNDAVEAGFGSVEPQVFVSVNGQPELAAVVADRYFKLMRLPLSQGLNRLTVRAVDSLGNERIQTLDVHRVDTGLAGLVPADGQDQAGAGRTELPKPLVVLALDANGEPIANQAVDFIVERGTGSLSPAQGQSASGNLGYTARAIRVSTDSQGRASAWFTIGKQSGPGANLVRAASPALGGEPVLFIASALRSEPARIAADLGTNQIGETDAQVMEILSAVIRDAGDNYMPGVRVQFRVEQGSAAFLDAPGATVGPGGQSIIVTTDKNGVAAVRPRLGSQPGIVRISAQAAKTAAADFADPSAVLAGGNYVIRVKQASDGPTSFSGFIYSDKGQPLQGVKVSIGRTSLLATSDDKGYFEIASAPPGRIDLFVDGRAVNPGNDPAQPQWPSLHFEAYVVRGQKNELPHAIYLPALLTSEAKVVGGTEDVVLTIPGLEGFSMTVKANSVTFPDGSRTGTLVVSPVTADKLPMAPPAGGAQFGVPAWTIQPAGTRFDPPIEVRMPNSTNEQPGDNLPVVQWDHDLGQYVPMGRATVSSDGAWLVTDSGSGVTKAGWGGVCRYDGCKTAISPEPCTECRQWTSVSKCEGSCKPDPAKDGKKCKGDACMQCKDGECVEKHSKVSSGVTEANFSVAIVTVPALPNAKANFNGYRTSSTKNADWGLDIDAYCTPEGVWKFKLSKADIKTFIAKPANPGFVELTDADINAYTGAAPVLCQKLNSAEFELHWASSTHYPGGSGGNPAVQALSAKNWGGIDGINAYDQWREVEAHERTHFARFKEYFATGWDAFKLTIARLQTPILTNDTSQDAKARMARDLENAIVRLHNATAEAQRPHEASGDHDPPVDFYQASIGAMSSTFMLLNTRRAAANCPP